MKITQLETLMANAGLRNYLFVRLTTDTGLTGLGEASLEWQEQTVADPAPRMGRGPRPGPRPVRRRGGPRRHDPRPVPGRRHRDDRHQRRRDRALGPHRQGLRPAGLSSCSAAAPATACPAYANGWYGGASTPAEYAEQAREAVARGYRRAEVRPVRHRLERSVARGGRGRGRRRRRRARGGRPRRRPDDRGPWPALGRLRHAR